MIFTELAETDGKEIPVFWVPSDGKEEGWVCFSLGRHTEMGFGLKGAEGLSKFLKLCSLGFTLRPTSWTLDH